MIAEQKRLSYTLVADGSRDQSLLPRVIRWVIRRVEARNFRLNPQVADFRSHRNPPQALCDRLKMAVKYYPCDILFVHRDAKREPRESRVAEIADAVREAGIGDLNVPVVPVRMTEA
jgi:hypothetical protein